MILVDFSIRRNMWSAAIVGSYRCCSSMLALFWFFGTEIGTALRAKVAGVNLK